MLQNNKKKLSFSKLKTENSQENFSSNIMHIFPELMNYRLMGFSTHSVSTPSFEIFDCCS